MRHFCCQIVPPKILEKLPIPNADAELTRFFIENRKFLLANPELKKRRKVTHKETRNLFDSANQYRFNETPDIVKNRSIAVNHLPFLPYN